MAEFNLSHECDPQLAQQLEDSIRFPVQGPIDSMWNESTISDHREVAWGMATQIADLRSLRERGEVTPSVRAYVSVRMAGEHSQAWERVLRPFVGHPEALRRKIYRLAERVGDIVTAYMEASDSE